MAELTDERIKELVAESQFAQPEGCCSDPTWRGRLCQYHMGYQDGLDRAQQEQSTD